MFSHLVLFCFGVLTGGDPDDGLSYCTWNGIGQHLTEQKLFDALESLAKNEINISNLIIDDNWQSLVCNICSGVIQALI